MEDELTDRKYTKKKGGNRWRVGLTSPGSSAIGYVDVFGRRRKKNDKLT